MSVDLSDVVSALRRRGFAAEYCADRAAALVRIREAAAGAKTFASGGSATLRELGVPEMLASEGLATFPHGAPEGQFADLYLLSANALLADGRIVNIDGTCNRVSASLYGPKRVVFAIGRNKIVEGGLDDAVARIKEKACPPNARRLGRRTPCATGRCADCSSPDRMCNVTVVFDRKPTRTDTLVLVIDDELGY